MRFAMPLLSENLECNIRINSNFAPEVILDFARLDRIGSLFGEDLEEVCNCIASIRP